MIRFSRRSRLTFSTPPEGIPISSSHRVLRPSERAPAPAPSSRPLIWTESGDVSEYLDASELMDDEDDDVIRVDDEAVDISDEEEREEERESEKFALPRAYRLPTPSLPPRRPSMQSLPATSFAPQPIKIKPLPLPLPPPSLPPVRDITPPPPVVELDEAAHANEIDAAPPSASRYPRPTWPWAAALVSLGAAAGFAISILTQVASGVATDDAQLTSAPVVAAQAAPQPEAFAAAGATHALRAESQPKTLRFDTPLDIRVHAGPAEGPPKNAEVAPKPKPVAAPAAPAQAPAKAPEPPKAAEREPENTFVRAPTRPAPRRDLPPQAVDALVREQLSTALR